MTVMSTITKAAGIKPDDQVIAMSALQGCKAKATLYCQATLEAATPEVRHMFSTHLQDSLTEHEQLTKLAVAKGWYPAYASPEELVGNAVSSAKPLLH